MAISQAMCSSFKQELLGGTHNLVSNSCKLALFTSSATLSAATTAYAAPSSASAVPTSTHEVSTGGSSNYTAAGLALANPVVSRPSSGTTATVDFDNRVFSNVTLTARGCLIYNDTVSDKAVAVLDFGSDKTATSGDFTIVFPANDANNAIIRLA